MDRTGTMRLATTDPRTSQVLISNGVQGCFFEVVLLHEIGHCSMVSYGLLPDIERFVVDGLEWEAEEWICNYLADYGGRIMEAAREVLGHRIYI